MAVVGRDLRALSPSWTLESILRMPTISTAGSCSRGHWTRHRGRGTLAAKRVRACLLHSLKPWVSQEGRVSFHWGRASWHLCINPVDTDPVLMNTNISIRMISTLMHSHSRKYFQGKCL